MPGLPPTHVLWQALTGGLGAGLGLSPQFATCPPSLHAAASLSGPHRCASGGGSQPAAMTKDVVLLVAWNTFAIHPAANLNMTWSAYKLAMQVGHFNVKRRGTKAPTTA